jgi:hypothetical protein
MRDRWYDKRDAFYQNITFAEFADLDRELRSQYKVLYLSKIQRLEFLVAAEEGRFYKATDGTVFRGTQNSVIADLGQGEYQGADKDAQMYACDVNGNLFVFNPNLTDKRTKQPAQVNHSTALAGKDVLCAGTISIKNGYLKGISSLSGHYLPDTGALTKLLTEFRDNQGVSMDNVVVMDMAKNITTSAVRYLLGDYTNRKKEQFVLNFLNATN